MREPQAPDSSPPPVIPEPPAPPVNELLIAYIRAQADLPCRGCGYNMGGLPGAICPECGRTFVMADLGQRPRPGWVNFLRGRRGALLLWVAMIVVLLWVSLQGPPSSETMRILFYGKDPGFFGGVGVISLFFAGSSLAHRVSRRPRQRARAGSLQLVAWGLMVLQFAGAVVMRWL
jgi:hypothetical protein